MSMVLFIILFTNIWINLLSLYIDNNYFIPKESSIFIFQETKTNDGSGDWWLYGEDKNNYYALNTESNNPRYYILEKGHETRFFDKFNYNTWNE